MSEDSKKPNPGGELQAMWKDFIKSVEDKGFNVQLLITYKQEIVQGMTARERGLVDSVVDAYLNASVQFTPKNPVAPAPGGEKKAEEAPEKAEEAKPEAEQEKVETKPEGQANPA